MAGYFGNAVVLKYGSTTIGQIKSISVPQREHPRVDFTVLGDTVQQMKLSPVMDAPELTVTLVFDRTQSDQDTLFGLVGTDTAAAWSITWPHGAGDDDVYSFNAKVYGDEISDVTSGDALEYTIKLVLTTTMTPG